MMERPPIRASGRITAIREEGRLYEVEMPNGYRAFAILERKGPPPPGDVLGREVSVNFSPFDMSRCKVVGWGKAGAGEDSQPGEPVRE